MEPNIKTTSKITVSLGNKSPNWKTMKAALRTAELPELWIPILKPHPNGI